MTGKQIANPLAAAIAAARKLPATTGATARAQARLDDPGVILADVSTSMDGHAGSRRKIDILQEAIDGLRDAMPVVAFASSPTDVPAGKPLPSPYGSTAMHLALDYLAGRRPSRVLVVSDGAPDDRKAALAAAGRLACRIDVIYCGPDDDREAIAFMQELARQSGGTSVVRDIAKRPRELAQAVRQLALPAR